MIARTTPRVRRTLVSGLLPMLLWISATSGQEVSAPKQAAQVLARWRGGELTREAFVARFDPQEKVLSGSPQQLATALCKAVYNEIYGQRARSSGLDRDPQLVAEHEAWRQRALATAYRARHQPVTAATLDEGEVRAFYQREREAHFSSAGNADLEVLFVRCGTQPEDRVACRSRIEQLQERLAQGTALSEVAAEERQHSGEANGSFARVPLSRLAPELAAAVQVTPVGELTPLIEAPIGYYRIKVVRRTDPLPLPFAQVERRARRMLASEINQRWQTEAVRRLRGKQASSPAAAASQDEDAVLAAAALAESLDREPAFMQREQQRLAWALADAAYYRHHEVHPTDPELEAMLEANPERYRQLWLLVAVVEGAGDRQVVVRTAIELRQHVVAADDPERALRQEAQATTAVSLHELGPVTLDELRRSHRPLVDIVRQLEVGGWQGPVTLASDDRSQAPLPAGPAFVLLTRIEMPTVDEARDLLLRQVRSRAGGGVESFLELIGSFWDVELLVPTAAGPIAAEGAL